METFVVRVYRSGHEPPPDHVRLRGVVEQIATGFQATFRDGKELLTILDRGQRENLADTPKRP